MCRAEHSLLTVSNYDYKTKKLLYEKLGDGACKLKIYSKAIDYYIKMLDSAVNNGESGSDLSSCYVSLAETYGDLKQFNMALEYYKKEYAISAKATKDSITMLLNIADCMEGMEMNVMEIENIYKKARMECVTAKEKHLEHKVLSRHISLLRKNGKLSQALELGEQLPEHEFAYSESESEPSQVQSTPDIGADISIGDITDISDDNDTENDTSKPRSVRKRVKRSVVNFKGETHLHRACIQGKLALVKRLLDQGHTVNVRDHSGWLPIHEACNYGYYEIVNILIQKGAAINDRGGTQCNGMTPLHDAAVNGHLEVMQLLLDNGASAIAKDDFGSMPLHFLKTWKLNNDQALDFATASLYENMVQRLSRDMEKLGHSDDLVVPNTVSALVLEEDNSKLTKQPKSNAESTKSVKSVGSERINRHIGALRRNISCDDDIDSTARDNIYSNEDSDSNDIDYTKPTHNHSFNREESVRDDYKRVMESLKHPNRKENIERKRKSNENNPRLAYLQGDEVEDDWLENDLIENQQKKRKTTVTAAKLINRLGTRKNSSELLKNRSSSSLNSKGSFTDDKSIADGFLDSDFDLYDPPMDSDILITDSNFDLGINRHSSFSNKRKSQISLIDAGFTRHRSFSPTSLTSNTNLVCQTRKHQSKLTNFGHTSSSIPDLLSMSVQKNSDNHNVSGSLKTDPMLSIDVRIDGKLYRVPVPASETHIRTVKWLADEATKRYSRKECMKPTLELETKNGAVLAEDDFIAILFSAGCNQAEEVEAHIVKWNLPPLCDRYNEACMNCDVVPNESLSKILQESTSSLILTDMCLENKHITSLCKAINRQINLHNLDLSGNVLQQESFQLLFSSLPTLDHLAILNLSLTNLTSESLALMADMFIHSAKPILESLMNLDLSYNPLYDECFKHLAILTRYLRLRNLKLVSVDFTSDIFNVTTNKNIELCLNELIHFDISNNKLEKAQIALFLSWLQPQKIEDFNISNNISLDEGLLKDVINWLNVGENQRLNLKTLDLSRCNTTDAEVFELLRILQTADQFESLNLSYNDNLTALSLRRLIQDHSTFIKLDLTGCENIMKYFDECTENTWNSIHLKHLRLFVDERTNAKKILSNIWENEYKEKARICELRGFLELSISD